MVKNIWVAFRQGERRPAPHGESTDAPVAGRQVVIRCPPQEVFSEKRFPLLCIQLQVSQGTVLVGVLEICVVGCTAPNGQDDVNVRVREGTRSTTKIDPATVSIDRAGTVKQHQDTPRMLDSRLEMDGHVAFVGRRPNAAALEVAGHRVAHTTTLRGVIAAKWKSVLPATHGNTVVRISVENRQWGGVLPVAVCVLILCPGCAGSVRHLLRGARCVRVRCSRRRGLRGRNGEDHASCSGTGRHHCDDTTRKTMRERNHNEQLPTKIIKR